MRGFFRRAAAYGATGAAVALFAAAVAGASVGQHLRCAMNGRMYGYSLFSNIKVADSNPDETALRELSHFDSDATAFGQYSVAVHVLLGAMSWLCGYEMTGRDRSRAAPLWYRSFVGGVLFATLIVAGLFIDLAGDHSTGGIRTSEGSLPSYRVRAYRGAGGYLLQFVPLSFCGLLWVRDR